MVNESLSGDSTAHHLKMLIRVQFENSTTPQKTPFSGTSTLVPDAYSIRWNTVSKIYNQSYADNFESFMQRRFSGDEDL